MRGYVFLALTAVTLLLSGCATKVAKSTSVPVANMDGVAKKVSLFALHNYTDTPDAGKRAANLVEGVMIAQGFEVLRHIDEGETSDRKAVLKAVSEGSDYLLLGGVSEWRYKTGIDGEPAVSLHMKMIDLETKKVVWSATASGNDWGNASIGTTAQKMIEEMLEH
ncbi:hypothetical protein [Hydrogenimonas sp.]